MQRGMMSPSVQQTVWGSSLGCVCRAVCLHCIGGAVMLLLFVCVTHKAIGACPSPCLCTSDIITCSGRNLSSMPSDLYDFIWRLDLSYNSIATLPSNWTLRPLDTLEMLVLNHNSLHRVEPDAFLRTLHLRHLDLSCNRMEWLNAGLFQTLGVLEELLLFDNRLRRISSGAFSGLRALRKLYLSRNRLTRFPLEVYEAATRLPQLGLFDLSWNLVREVPVLGILSAPAWQQAGIYLHGNPLACRCSLRAMLQQWERRHFRGVLDFRTGYACLGRMDAGRLNCSGGLPDVSQRSDGATYRAWLGERLLVPCPGTAALHGTAVLWESPGRGAAVGTEGRLRTLPNGTLEIRGVQPEDFGTFTCAAVRGRWRGPKETVEVAIAGDAEGPLPSRPGEHFNTAFTTLASCAVSIVLVLAYLYLTPCRCQGLRGGKAALLCRDARDVEHEARPCSGKRVAFLEPGAKPPTTESEEPPAVTHPVAMESILKNGKSSIEGVGDWRMSSVHMDVETVETTDSDSMGKKHEFDVTSKVI